MIDCLNCDLTDYTNIVGLRLKSDPVLKSAGNFEKIRSNVGVYNQDQVSFWVVLQEQESGFEIDVDFFSNDHSFYTKNDYSSFLSKKYSKELTQDFRTVLKEEFFTLVPGLKIYVKPLDTFKTGSLTSLLYKAVWQALLNLSLNNIQVGKFLNSSNLVKVTIGFKNEASQKGFQTNPTRYELQRAYCSFLNKKYPDSKTEVRILAPYGITFSQVKEIFLS